MKTFKIKVQETYCVDFKVTANCADEAWTAFLKHDGEPSPKYDEQFYVGKPEEIKGTKHEQRNDP